MKTLPDADDERANDTAPTEPAEQPTPRVPVAPNGLRRAGSRRARHWPGQARARDPRRKPPEPGSLRPGHAASLPSSGAHA
jgi:hypothetical protein